MITFPLIFNLLLINTLTMNAQTTLPVHKPHLQVEAEVCQQQYIRAAPLKYIFNRLIFRLIFTIDWVYIIFQLCKQLPYLYSLFPLI